MICPQVSLRSVNSSRSAYACVFFSPMFFQRYSCKNAPEMHLNKSGIRLAYKLVIKVHPSSSISILNHVLTFLTLLISIHYLLLVTIKEIIIN